MLLYVIAIEILSLPIRNNTLIKGIKIPNQREEFKMLQHADDCTNFIIDSNSFAHLQKEYEAFGRASGSKINHDKTEKLKIGNWRENHPGLPPHLIKNRVKALGIFFGQNEEKENLIKVQKKIDDVINIWAQTPFSLIERSQVAKTYMYSNLNYLLNTVDIKNKTLEKIDNKIVDYIWKFQDTLYK